VSHKLNPGQEGHITIEEFFLSFRCGPITAEEHDIASVSVFIKSRHKISINNHPGSAKETGSNSLMSSPSSGILLVLGASAQSRELVLESFLSSTEDSNNSDTEIPLLSQLVTDWQMPLYSYNLDLGTFLQYRS
jgi:hypothetical protein